MCGVGVPTSEPPDRGAAGGGTAQGPTDAGGRPLQPEAVSFGELPSSPEPLAVQTLPSPHSSLAMPVPTPPLKPRRRDQSLWLWPAGALAVIAVLNQLLGPIAALLAATALVATLLVYVGDRVLPEALRLVIVAAALVAATGLVVGQRLPARLLQSNPPEASDHVVDLRGKRVTADDMKSRDMRGANLAGAILDDLDLTGMQLDSIRAPGASFRRATLERVGLVGADLRGADLTDTCLRLVDLTNASLDGANATNARITAVTVAPDALARVAGWPAQSSGLASCR
jgi:Pentapeptide repeats (8 copies)